MIRYFVAAALMVPFAAHAAWLDDTQQEAANAEQAHGICSFKVNLLVQAATDRDRGVPDYVERQTLTMVARNVTGVTAGDVAQIVDDSYSMSTEDISQIATTAVDACMLPFN